MNTPGGRPPAKFWRFLASGVVNWRSCFWLDFFWDAILFLWRKTSVVEDFLKLCLCHNTSTDSKWSTSIVKSKILPIVFVEDIPVKALMPNLFQLYQKTLLEVFDWIFWSLWIGNFHDSGLDYGYARICLKNHRGRVEMTFQTELCMCKSVCIYPDILTVKSKILPIVFVEDIPVKALMPNLVQLTKRLCC